MFVAVISLAVMGALFGIILGIAGKKFAVENDPRVDKIIEIMPGANCGACGLAGCAVFAEAVVAGEVNPKLCTPGGAGLYEKIAAIMGTDAESYEERKVARLLCQGGVEQCRVLFDYKGVEDCHLALASFKGPKSCNYGCVRMGNCSRACPFGAIQMGADGLPVVDCYICTGCNKCVVECPQQTLKLIGVSHSVVVHCLNSDKGKDARLICSTACIKCKICEKNCPENAVHVEDFGSGTLAVIDYEKCTDCGICAAKCPTRAIQKNDSISEAVLLKIGKPKDEEPACQSCGLCKTV
ncbi:MAG: RnfABCDGE type electron transport complex subunit B [Desulfuromonadaceae bacterium]|nr:RnfABCDGE type electron transport complex subunit B [Desulfuromonadaceae bacterium]MDD2855237.1 RnfABCDGE type electron transport complex subunit B [Desulfuromonadaceae bacterium]